LREGALKAPRALLLPANGIRRSLGFRGGILEGVSSGRGRRVGHSPLTAGIPLGTCLHFPTPAIRRDSSPLPGASDSAPSPHRVGEGVP